MLIEERPRRAWRRVCQAVRLLGSPEVPDGVSEEATRGEAWRTLLATAARLLVDGVPQELGREELLKASDEALKELGIEDPRGALGRFGTWSESRSGSTLEMFEAILDLEGEDEWLRAALTPVAQELRREIEEGSRTPARAEAFRGNVVGWLGLSGYAGDSAEESRRLRCQAVDTLLESGDPEAAESVLRKVAPADPLRAARVMEAQGHFAPAAEAFQRPGKDADALRNWREAGRFEAALRLAEGVERDDLAWLVKLEQLGGRRPEDQRKRLTGAERRRLEQLLESLRKGVEPPRRRKET